MSRNSTSGQKETSFCVAGESDNIRRKQAVSEINAHGLYSILISPHIGLAFHCGQWNGFVIILVGEAS